MSKQKSIFSFFSKNTCNEVRETPNYLGLTADNRATSSVDIQHSGPVSEMCISEVYQEMSIILRMKPN